MKRKILLSSLMTLVSIETFAKTQSTPLTVQNDLILVYIQAACMGLFLSLLMLGIVSMIKYDLIDNRIRKQKDVRKRRVTFFVFMILLPAIWFYSLFSFSYDQMAGTIGTYFVDMTQHAFVLKQLFHAYCVQGPFILMISYFLFFVLFSWLLAKYFSKYKARTVVYSNFKFFGIIGKKEAKK
jgi:hypothetical protein